VLLQCVAVCCSVLQCVAVRFEVDLLCSPSFLIQSDLCIVYFYDFKTHIEALIALA